MSWVITAYNNAPAEIYWKPHNTFQHFTLSLMLITIISIIAALTPINSDERTDGPQGIYRVTRQPMMWGITLCSTTHELDNGELYALIFFGGLTVQALAGTVQVNRRKACLEGNIWQAYAAKGSHIPFAAILAKRTHFSAKKIGCLPVILGIIIYLVLLILHETVIGIAAISRVSGLFD